MNLNKFKALPKEQMKKTKGGIHRTVSFEDVNGDGVLDKVIRWYDNEWRFLGGRVRIR